MCSWAEITVLYGGNNTFLPATFLYTCTKHDTIVIFTFKYPVSTMSYSISLQSLIIKVCSVTILEESYKYYNGNRYWIWNYNLMITREKDVYNKVDLNNLCLGQVSLNFNLEIFL